MEFASALASCDTSARAPGSPAVNIVESFAEQLACGSVSAAKAGATNPSDSTWRLLQAFALRLALRVPFVVGPCGRRYARTAAVETWLSTVTSPCWYGSFSGGRVAPYDERVSRPPSGSL